jgi:uroporphyrinogen-III synthase
MAPGTEFVDAAIARTNLADVAESALAAVGAATIEFQHDFPIAVPAVPPCPEKPVAGCIGGNLTDHDLQNFPA